MKAATVMPDNFSALHYISEVRLELGGVVQAVIDLCQAISVRGHDVTLVTCDATDVPANWKEPGGNWPKVVQISASSLSKRLISRQGLETIQGLLGKVDIVHLHTPWDLGNYQLISMLRQHSLPYVVTVHGMLDDWSMHQKSLKKRTFLTLLGNSLFKYATTVHCTAEEESIQAAHWVPIGERGAIQCYALDLTSYDPLPGPDPAMKAFPQIQADKHKILFLSRLHPKKGIELLLQAGAILHNDGWPIQLLIAGPGEDRYVQKLEKLANRLGLQGETVFLGMVRGIEKRSLYQLSDVFVLPTYQENFGLVIAEAMACGTAVVTTRGTDIWREITHGGARIADFTPQSVAENIQELLSDPEKIKKVGQQGLQFVRNWLDREHVTDGYERLYRQTIQLGPRF